MDKQTQRWLDQIPSASNRLAIMAAAFGLMLAIVFLYDRMGWLS